jgi:predicted esterase
MIRGNPSFGTPSILTRFRGPILAVAFLLLTAGAAAMSAGEELEPGTGGGARDDSGGPARIHLLHLPPEAARARSAASVTDAERLSLVVILDTSEIPSADPPGYGRLTSRTVASAYPSVVAVIHAPGDPADRATTDRILDLVDGLLFEQPVDPGRVYVAGASASASAVWALVGREPGRFAAAVVAAGPFVPVVIDPAVSGRIAGLPVWIFHGAHDETVPVTEARRVVSALWAAGSAVVRYTEYQRLGHRVWETAWADRQLVQWLFSQVRS